MALANGSEAGAAVVKSVTMGSRVAIIAAMVALALIRATTARLEVLVLYV